MYFFVNKKHKKKTETKQQKQNKNNTNIFKKGGMLCDKFCQD